MIGHTQLRAAGKPTGARNKMKANRSYLFLETKLILLALGLSQMVVLKSPAQIETPQPKTTLFQNVRVFDGKSDKLSKPMNVLVRENKIEEISAETVPTDRRADTLLINGAGRTLMPGLIDNHVHVMLA